jgi:hypothetical protein
MRGLAVFRWLTPAALAALLSVPLQFAGAHPMGGGGHSMGGMGARSMRGRPAASSHFFNRNGMGRFAHPQNLAFRTHDFDRFHRGDRFFDRRDQFRDNHFFFQRNFFFRHNFFVGFDFAAFGFPWWGPWGPWWWYPDYADYPYSDDPPASGAQYDSDYWNNLAMNVQTKLADQGYYHGQVDGVLGSGSLQAVRQFQADHKLAVTGKVDPKLLKALGIDYQRQS